MRKGVRDNFWISNHFTQIVPTPFLQFRQFQLSKERAMVMPSTRTEVKQDTYIRIDHPETDPFAYTNNVANCWVFGIRYKKEGAPKVLFGHFSPKQFEDNGERCSEFGAMIRELDGASDVTIEVLTNFGDGANNASERIKEVLGKHAENTTFHLSYVKSPYCFVTIFQKYGNMWASTTAYDETKYGGHESQIHRSPGFSNPLTETTQKGCCVIL